MSVPDPQHTNGIYIGLRQKTNNGPPATPGRVTLLEQSFPVDAKGNVFINRPNLRFEADGCHASDSRPDGYYISDADAPILIAMQPGDDMPPIRPPHLEVRGNDFVDDQGQPACYSGVDQFKAFRMFLDGQTAELEALIAESLSFDFRWWRVFMMGSLRQNFVIGVTPTEAGYYDHVRPFADFLNTRGIGLLAVIYVDNQDVKADVPGHWQRMADLLRGSVTILDGGNEYDKNGFDPQALTDPHMIWSRGSATADKVTPQNGAPVASFHQRTDWPATMTDAVASELFMRDHGYTVVMMDEPTRFDENSNKSGQPDSVRFAYVLARIYGGLWDLAVFHNHYGQVGQLMSPNVRAVAASWQRGLRG
jgi:hypothetical protein